MTTLATVWPLHAPGSATAFQRVWAIRDPDGVAVGDDVAGDLVLSDREGDGGGRSLGGRVELDGGGGHGPFRAGREQPEVVAGGGEGEGPRGIERMPGSAVDGSTQPVGNGRVSGCRRIRPPGTPNGGW